MDAECYSISAPTNSNGPDHFRFSKALGLENTGEIVPFGVDYGKSPCVSIIMTPVPFLNGQPIIDMLDDSAEDEDFELHCLQAHFNSRNLR